MKTCPFCAEEIQDATIGCRVCNRAVPQQTEAEITGSQAFEVEYLRRIRRLVGIV